MFVELLKTITFNRITISHPQAYYFHLQKAKGNVVKTEKHVSLMLKRIIRLLQKRREVG